MEATVPPEKGAAHSLVDADTSDQACGDESSSRSLVLSVFRVHLSCNFSAASCRCVAQSDMA